MKSLPKFTTLLVAHTSLLPHPKNYEHENELDQRQAITRADWLVDKRTLLGAPAILHSTINNHSFFIDAEIGNQWTDL